MTRRARGIRSRERKAFIAVALALALGVGACGDDPAGPPRSLVQVALATTDFDGPTIYNDNQGDPRVRCEMTFRATVSGTGSARWEGATVFFFAGADRSAPVDTLTFTAREVEEAWGVSRLTPGETVESQWWFEMSVPFAVAGTFHYMRSPDVVADADFDFTCGPDVSENSALPTITELSLDAPADGLEPSDTLFVSYTAKSTVGMWATAVELSGPCAVFVELTEQLQTDVVRTVPLAIPPGCTLGAPVRVTVYAADAGLRLVARQATGPVLVDHTPPKIDILGIIPIDGAFTSRIQFSADTLQVSVSANDNRGLRTIVYELLPAGIRDSIATASSFFGVLSVPIPAGVTGLVQVRLFGRDITGLTNEGVTTAPDAIMVYPTIERPTLHTVLEGDVRDIVVDARGPIYVIQRDRARILVLSSTSLQVTRSIALPYFPTSVDFTPGGDSLLVTGGSRLSVVDLVPSAPVVSEVPLTLNANLGQRPERVVVLANGRAYVALSGNAAQAEQLLELDLATGEHRIRADAADANGIAAAATIQRSPDQLAFVFNGGPGRFRRYDATTDQFTVGGNVFPPHVMLSSDRGAEHSALSLSIYDASLAFVRRVESIFQSGVLSVPSMISADGEFLYHLGSPGIMRSRVSDGVLVDRTRNPIQGAMIRIASDDSFIVTALGYISGDVSLVRLK